MPESKPVILVADDEEDIKEILKMYLEGCGFDVVTAFDGLDAAQKAKECHPALILMDIMMPVMDGIEVTKMLKASGTTREIPVVMLTAAAQSAMVQKAMEAGATAYISKPFEPDQVREVIEKTIGQA
ncbi:response regulator [Candidatus Sumerlaeota bacterium]|nr:response regulator [Candidatus Sumerlaeota bacterium]